MSKTAPELISELQAEVTVVTQVDQSATTLINGFAARQQQAIQDALANGATQEQLQPLQDFNDALVANSTALAAAVAANTPAAPAPAPDASAAPAPAAGSAL